MTKISLKLCRSACMDELEFMWIIRHRRVRVHVDRISRHRRVRVGIYVDQPEWMSFSSCRSAGKDEFEFM
jgi:hypothetical protein